MEILSQMPGAVAAQTNLPPIHKVVSVLIAIQVVPLVLDQPQLVTLASQDIFSRELHALSVVQTASHASQQPQHAQAATLAGIWLEPPATPLAKLLFLRASLMESHIVTLLAQVNMYIGTEVVLLGVTMIGVIGLFLYKHQLKALIIDAITHVPEQANISIGIVLA